MLRRIPFGLSSCSLTRALKGDAVSENEPFYTSFVWTGPVSQGRIRKVKMDIYSDRNQRDAPIARDDDVALLCHVEADISHIPEHMLNRRQGNDGQVGHFARESRWRRFRGHRKADRKQQYYELSCKIEAVCKLKPYGPYIGGTDLLTMGQISRHRRNIP